MEELYISSINPMEIIAPMFINSIPSTGKLLFTCSAIKAPDGEITLYLHEHCLI